MDNVAVIGAGLCGATAAAKLAQSGYRVSLFDKGRSVGGRMSSKRTEAGYLDMGAQYFTARSAQFQAQVQSWLDAGCVAQWSCATASLSHDGERAVLEDSADQQQRFIGAPSMQAPVKALLQGVPVTVNCRIHRVQRQQAGWTLLSESGERYTGFAAVLLTIPPVQASQLLSQSGLPDLLDVQDSLLEPCWAVALRAGAIAQGDAIFCQHPQLRFVSHQATKGGRDSCYIVHFSAGFSRQHLEQPAEFWFQQAADLLRAGLGVEGELQGLAAHRWLYASQNPDLEPPGIIERPDEGLWFGGDWSFGGRVENAFLAGSELASAVIRHGSRISMVTDNR